VVIYGPDAAQTSPVPLGAWVSALTGSSIMSSLVTPVTFRNCLFIIGGADVPAVFLAGAHKYTFENCTFISLPGINSHLFKAQSGADIHLRNCYFYATEGQCLLASDCTGTVEDCVFVADGGGTATFSVSDPRIIEAGVALHGRFTWKNNWVIIGKAASRATSAQNALIRLGDINGNAPDTFIVEGLYIRYTTGTGLEIHNGPTLYCQGNAFATCTFSDIIVDYNGLTRTTSNDSLASGFPSLVCFNNTRGRRIRTGNLGTPGGAIDTDLLVFTGTITKMYDIHLDMGVGGDITHYWDSCLYMDNEVTLDGVMLEAAGGSGAVSAFLGLVYMKGNTTLRNCSSGPGLPNQVQCAAGTPAFIHVIQDDVIISGLDLEGVGQNVCPTILLDDCNRAQILNFRIVNDVVSGANFVIAITGGSSTSIGRQHMIANGFIYWNGSTKWAIDFSGNDGLAANIIGRRSVGSQSLAVTFGGSTTVFSNNIISTV